MTSAATMLHQHSSAVSRPTPDRLNSLRSPKSEVRRESRQADEPLLACAARINGAHAILFGRFRLVLRSRELLADGVPVPVGSRATDVLMALIKACGELVTKDELLSQVWPRTTVGENNLQFQISSLRKALGADRDFIKTVSGRGYRFTAEVTTEWFATRPSNRKGVSGQGSAVVRLHEARPNRAVPMSDLIDRDDCLSDIAGSVTANRLATLAGADDIDRTRLALELARRLLSRFANGVRGTEPGPPSNSECVPTTIPIGLDNASAAPETLAAALVSKHMLLVLDHCEHAIDTVQTICSSLAGIGNPVVPSPAERSSAGLRMVSAEPCDNRI